MIRRIISLTVLVSFLLLAVSSVILYIVPEGRVAYWSDWTILGLSKSQWGNVHIINGFLFIFLSLWHLILNWGTIVRYIKKSLEKNAKSPIPLLTALLLNIFIFGGTLLGWQPMKQILDWNADIKKYQANKNGNPPYGHAELSSLESFCGFLGLDADAIVSGLKEKQLKGVISKQSTIIEIAKANNMTPQRFYEVIRSISSSGDPFSLLPEKAPEGTGKMTLGQLCNTYGLSSDIVLQKLNEKGVEASLDQLFKQIAESNNMQPHELFSLLKKD